MISNTNVKKLFNNPQPVHKPKEQVPDGSAQGIQQKIVHVEDPQHAEQLEGLESETDQKNTGNSMNRSSKAREQEG